MRRTNKSIYYGLVLLFFAATLMPALPSCSSPDDDDDGGSSTPSNQDINGVIGGGSDVTDVTDDDDDDSSTIAEAPYDLEFTGVDFGTAEGLDLEAAVVNVSTGAVVAMQATTVVGGTFTVSWIDLLQDGTEYRIDYYADANVDGQCSPQPADYTWMVEFGPVSEDTVLEESFSFSFDDGVCSSF